MVKNIGWYLLGISTISALLVVSHWSIPLLFPRYQVSKGVELILLFSFLFLFLHGATLGFSKGRAEWFAQIFLVQTTLKMLILLSLFLLLSRIFPYEKLSITALFFSCYILFTLHDLFWLLRFVKKNSSVKVTNE